MGIKETNLRIETERNLTKFQRLWRANSGKVQLINRCWLQLFPKGTPDMIGFDSIIITPEMVGKRVAVFVGSELKATKYDKLSKDQRNFKDLIIDKGGIHREHRADKVIESGFLNIN